MLYYLNYDGIRCSVFESQILTPLLLLQKQGWTPRLINYEKEGEIAAVTEETLRCSQRLEVPAIMLHKKNYCNFVIWPQYVAQLCQVLREQPSKGQSIILHARGCFAGYIAIQARNKLRKEMEIKVITDFRGLVSEEYRLNHEVQNQIRRKVVEAVSRGVSRLEKYTAKQSDSLLCVSHRFKRYMSEQYAIESEKITVIPTCIDQERFRYDADARNRLRSELNLQDCFVIVYCGGAQSWQSPDLIFQAFLKIRLHHKRARLLLISGEKALFEQYAVQYQLQPEDYRIVKAPYQVVNQYLSVGDCGLLLRKADPVNEVASPTKFAEYLCCRLPVVATRDVGDLADYVERYQVGLFDDELERLKEKIGQIHHESYNKVINEHFNWDVNLARLIQKYQTLT